MNAGRFPQYAYKNLGNICRIRTGKLDANAMVVGGKYRFYTCAREFYQIDEYAFDTEALLISVTVRMLGTYIITQESLMLTRERMYWTVSFIILSM
jgi:hypothetical protein